MRRRSPWRGIVAALCIPAMLISCAGLPSSRDVIGGEPTEREIRYPAVGEGVEMVGTARVDLPRARLRGSCRVLFMPPGSLRIDFRHASLFGAWREDATILVRGDSLLIFDRERGTLLDGPRAIELVAGHLEAPFRPGDLIAAFLFREIVPEGDGRWLEDENGRLSGRMEGRRVYLDVDERGRPVLLRVLGDGAREACDVAYTWGGPESGMPERYEVTKEFGDGRLSMTVKKAERRPLSPGEFDVGVIR